MKKKKTIQKEEKASVEWTHYLPAFLIIAAGFLSYANSLGGKFLYDDEILITGNAYVKDWSHISEIFTRSTSAGAGEENLYYRPLEIFIFLVNYTVWGNNTTGFHLTSVFVHIMVALSIFWICILLTGNRFLSALTGLLFVVHPVHTEAVSFISGLADPLAALWILLSFGFYIKYLKSDEPELYIFSLLACFLAFLSRENSVILPVLLLLYHVSFSVKIRLKTLVPFFIMSVFYVLLRLTVFRFAIDSVHQTADFFQRLPGFFIALASYMKLLILPADLHYEYEMKFFQFSDLRAISGMILVCFAVFSAYKAWKNKPLIFFSIIWFFTALLPVSNLYSLTPYAYMAERWLYLPSFGFFILLSMILSFIYQNISRMRIPVSGFITAVLFWHCSMTIEQNHYWKDPITFYERTLKFIPDNAKINTNLGQSYFDAGRIEESVATLQKALILDPKFADAYNDLGSVYAQTGQPEKAIPLFQKYIELKPSDPKGYNNLANAYGVTGETEKAVDLYQKALSIAPDFENARHNLAIIRQGNFKPQQVQKSQKETSLSLDEDAVRKVKAMLEINPGDSAAYGQLGMLYFSGGKTEEAIKAFTRAVSISPDSPHLQNNLGAILITAEKYPDAVSHLKIAIQLNPDYAEAHSNISIAYYRTGQNSLAVLHSDKAVKLGYRVDPEFRKMLEQYR